MCHSPKHLKTSADISTAISEAIEVLCKLRAFVVKRPLEGHERPLAAQVTWSRHGGAHSAWGEALTRAGVGVPVLGGA